MKARLLIASLTLGLIAVPLASADAMPGVANDPSAPRVTTLSGVVEGASSGAVDRFLGIPYAAPPVGDRRWRPPAPAGSWRGVKEATSYGAPCLQPYRPDASEDCLYLNVYRPSDRTSKRLPVLFWIHGGGFSNGSGDEHNGALLAEANNIVVVSINYRLGAFGFLNFPGLSADGSGNFGLLDQIAALRWTKQNIGRFGGDPKRITISGLSAGGHSVCALLASPDTRGLMNGAIIHSGGCPSHTPAESEADSRRFVADAGCEGAADEVACLRELSSAEVLTDSARFRGGILSGPLPTAGVPELPIAPQKAIRTGRYNKVPILMGSTKDEVRGWAYPFARATEAQYRASLDYLFGDRAEDVLKAYPWDDFPSTDTAAYALGAVWTDSSVFYGLGGCQYADLADQIARRQPATYLYRFDAPRLSTNPPNPGAFDPGAGHGADQAYIWPTAESRYSPDQVQLSMEMVRYWGAFVRTGHPTASGQATWPSVRKDKVMILRPGGSSAVDRADFDRAHHCDLWDDIDYDWLDLDPGEFAAAVGVTQ